MSRFIVFYLIHSVSNIMGFYGFLWVFMGFYGFLWVFMGFYGFLWVFIILSSF
ncbi:hypothetical protein G2583_pO550111 (plasmid) [Escherichia coli O55:H7 str. CB9615]|nr:hypothetical protein G2583_pO550111 [Escherichia coli O55:H7 str. CB9615]